MIEITMQEPGIGVVELPGLDGIRVLRVVDPNSGITISVPMDIMSATKVARMLMGKDLVVPEPGLPRRGSP